MSKKKNVYNLENIEKVITYIPAIFIILLTAILLFISYVALNSKAEREIEVYKQQLLIKQEFKEKEKLQNFARDVKKRVNSKILGARSNLQKYLYTTLGYIDKMVEDGKNIEDVVGYLKSKEMQDDKTFVFFDTENFKVYMGEEVVSYLRELIFGSKDGKKYDKLVLQYIYSQGDENFQYWIDDIKKTVRVSFFDFLKVGGKLYCIGAFSTIDSLRGVTENAIISSINAFRGDDYIWFYDFVKKRVYNFYNKKEFYDAKKVLEHYRNEPKYEILKYYQSKDSEFEKYKNRIYLFKKFKFIVSIEYDISGLLKNSAQKLDSIKNFYDSMFYKILFYVLLISAFVLLFSLIFLRFVKDVFKRYNRRLQLRKESLQHWKKRFELAIIASNDGMWDIDFEKNSIYLSKKWLEISGYGRDEIKSFADWFNLIHKDDKDEVKNRFDAILEGKEEQLICEYRLKTKNEGYKWILARGKIFKNEYDNYKRMLMMSMDIDKNKRLSKELLNVEMLVEDGHIVIFKWNNDKDLSVDFVSNSIKSYGYYKKDFENKSLNYMDIVFQEDKRELRDLIDYHIAISSKSFFQIYRIVDNGGKIRWIYSRVLLLKDDFGEVKYLYGYIHDITKLKQAEEELKERVEEEIAKNREKDGFIIQQNKLASMGEMLGSISHQWRQPLNNVNLILHFIRDNCQSNNFTKEKLSEYINRAKTQIEYMSQTIEDFRNFYKPSKSKNRFELKECILSSLRIVEKQLESHGIVVNLICKNDIFLYNYENELKQSLLNILNNAKDAILQRKEREDFEAKIDIDIQDKNDVVVISIKNNGGEIDKEIIDRIFEPYFTTKFETQGTGLGLYMTKTIVEKNLQGKIGVKNIKNGVVFTIELPHKEKSI
ncbi:MAG: PAS domain-containing protein [Epsilonproteobacteria bacterium]|nr:PAS domain-containing protein [Campylobacterota bacterium]